MFVEAAYIKNMNFTILQIKACDCVANFQRNLKNEICCTKIWFIKLFR